MSNGHGRLQCVVLASLLTVCLPGCSTEPAKTSRLDSSGLTVVTHAGAILLARPTRTLAAGARDYAYVGPVEINRMGKREYFFWVGLASTVDRERIGRSPADAIALALLIDNDAMVLPLVDWNTELDVPPYVVNAPIYAALAARTSLDQIHRIADAASVEFHIIADHDDNARYQTWNGDWTTWSAFPADN